MKSTFLCVNFFFLFCSGFLFVEHGEATTQLFLLYGANAKDVLSTVITLEKNYVRSGRDNVKRSEKNVSVDYGFYRGTGPVPFLPVVQPWPYFVVCKADGRWIPKKGTMRTKSYSTGSEHKKASYFIQYSLSANGDVTINEDVSFRSSRFYMNSTVAYRYNLDTGEVRSLKQSAETDSSGGLLFDQQHVRYDVSAIPGVSRMSSRYGWESPTIHPTPPPRCYADTPGFGRGAILDPAQFMYGTAQNALKNFHKAAAAGIAMDGVSLGLLAYNITDGTQSPVIFEIKDAIGGERGLLFPYTPNYQQGQIHSRRHTGQRKLSIPPSTFVRVGNAVYALAWYLAPRTSAVILESSSIIIGVQQATKILENLEVDLYAPPVVTLHGIWGDADSWDHLIDDLVTRSYPAAVIVKGSYAPLFNTLAFDLQTPYGSAADSFEDYIGKALKEARTKRIIVTQVDVVTHSMGGLVARHYTAERIEAGQYSKAENYQQGTINHLITVGGPHLGTQLMNWAYPRRNLNRDLDKSACWRLLLSDAYHRSLYGYCLLVDDITELLPLAGAMKLAGRPLYSGARSLQYLSENINRLNTRPGIPYFALRAVAPETSINEQFMDTIAWLYQDGKIYTVDKLMGVDHDTAVPRDSQAYGAYDEVGIANVVHGGPGLCSANPFCTEDQRVIANQQAFDVIVCILSNDWQNHCAATAATALLTTSEEPSTGSSGKSPSVVSSQSATPALDIDLSGRTEVAADFVQFSPVSGGTLKAANGQTVTVSATGGKTIERVVFLIGLSLIDDTTSPFSAKLSLREAQKLDVAALVLFNDNTYAHAASKYSIAPPGTLVFIEAEKAITLRKPGWKAPLGPRAFYSESVKGFDISSKAKYATKSKTENIISISTTGIVTANAPGAETVIISYGGQSTKIIVKVNPEV